MKYTTIQVQNTIIKYNYNSILKCLNFVTMWAWSISYGSPWKTSYVLAHIKFHGV